MKKRRLAFLLALLLLSLCSLRVSLAASSIPVESIVLDREDAVLFVGKTLTVTAKALPKNATVKTKDWLSSDESVATVTKGKIKGIKPGTATITARSTDGTNVEASLQVTVVIPVSKITVDNPTPSLAPGETLVPMLHFEPENAGIQTLFWKTSNGKIATVDEDGTITALQKGKCTVTGIATDGSGKSVTLRVKVLDLPAVKPEDKGTDLVQEPSSDSVEVFGIGSESGETDSRKAEVLPWSTDMVNNMEIKNSSWITVQDNGDLCPVFRRIFETAAPVESAELQITSLGIYEATLNGIRVGDYVLAPGWTSYQHRLQVQRYDITQLLEEQNELQVTVGRGWFRSPTIGNPSQPCGLLALLIIRYANGTTEMIPTDESWQGSESPVRFSEIYNGETYDARIISGNWQPAVLLDWSKDILIPQEGEIIRETEQVAARRVFRTPSGEILVDFGQEVTGYVEFSVDANAGDLVCFDHGEVLDKKGNFYNANYRNAKAEVRYFCRDGRQTWHPRLTFFGFRYIRLINWPGTPRPEQFKAIVVHSDLQRTGWLESGSEMLNRLFSNIIWSQRDNFLDVPTDCPQRDERLGWTGDAQVFIKAASYLFNTERFYRKWLKDLAADQHEDGAVSHVVPDSLPTLSGSAAWGDAATICPWRVYQTYGDPSVLADQYECMKRWVDYITLRTTTKDLWTGCSHYGDWLGLDAPRGSYKGSSRDDFIASAFYAHSTELLVKTGKLLGRDVSEYEALYQRIVNAFRTTFPKYNTQTEYALAVQFRLAPDLQGAADDLAQMIRSDGTQLRTGFVGTPYILHVLSQYGHADLAWDLLLREDYPGWLYPITKGATTIWEHWDGIQENGDFWSPDMNSFNHYAYGSVADWVFEQAAGISHDEEHPGFSELIWEPHPDQRIGWLTVSLETRHGMIRASWRYEDDRIRYELSSPVPAVIRVAGKTFRIRPGNYTFWSK